MVRDFSKFALQKHGINDAINEQRSRDKEIMLIDVQADEAQYNKVWEK